MKKISLFISMLLIAGTLLTSCRSDPKEEGRTDEERFGDLKAEFHPAISGYMIDPTVSNTLEGVKGTKIEFEPNSFYYPDGSMVADSVSISMTELLKANDFVLQGSSTVTTGEDLLRSGGQLVITAEAGGQGSDLFGIRLSLSVRKAWKSTWTSLWRYSMARIQSRLPGRWTIR
ncbi:MAG: hypothetical protein KL787_09365 [Taibaiella sp.]|nr:hypothetical protein [Taibaiella sp.]